MDGIVPVLAGLLFLGFLLTILGLAYSAFAVLWLTDSELALSWGYRASVACAVICGSLLLISLVGLNTVLGIAPVLISGAGFGLSTYLCYLLNRRLEQLRSK